MSTGWCRRSPRSAGARSSFRKWTPTLEFPNCPAGCSIAPGQGEAIIIPTKPTHVSTEAVSLFQQQSGTAAAVGQLQPFTVVTLVKREPGWLLVAREGKLLGYAPEAKLHKLN